MIDNLFEVYVYPDKEVYTNIPDWKSDDYEIRKTTYCEECDELLQPHYAEPFASCECRTMEWHH